MRRLIPLLLACMAPALPAAVVPVIVYHDVVHGTSDDPYAVRASDFRAHMNFLRRAGYHPIRLADYVRAANDDAPLPEKPILLTFDDGLASFQDIVLPVLEEHGFPAVLSVTTGWLDGRDVPDNYRGRLLTAAMLQAVSRSPLVEVLSHTDRLHQGLVADPYGSLAPAAITRRYLGEGHYESEVAYRQRVRADLQRSRLRLTEATGRPPAGITWPYGHHNSVLIEEAAVLGMSAQLVLDDALADTRRYPRISRRLLFKAKNLASFEEAIHPPRRVPPARLLEVRLDELVVASGEQQRRWLDRLVEQVRLMRVDTAIVSPFSRDRRAAFFANPVMPARADLLHRALHVLRSAGGVGQILLRLPPDGVSREVYTELARRHPYDGIVLSGAPTASTAADLLGIFSFHRPGLRCGTERGAEIADCRDFRLLAIPAHADSKLVARQARGQQPIYVLLEDSEAQDHKRLPEILRALRQAGIRHYGLEHGAHFENPGLFQKLAMEMAKPTATR